MNRRTFLATTLAVTPIAAPAAELREFEVIEPSPADPERIVVRVDRLTESSPPLPTNLDDLVELGYFEYLGVIRGEYWVGEFEPVPIPGSLPSPALAVDFESSAGVAGFRQEHTLGMVEDADLRWTIRASAGAREDRTRFLSPSSRCCWPADVSFPVRIADE